MFSTIWHTFFFDPIYNGLVFFINVMPGGDVGLSIIAITIVVKFLLLPFSVKAAKLQKFSREMKPKLDELKVKYKDDREGLAREMMALYKEAGISPFSTIFLLLIQLPILIALYLSVVGNGGAPLPNINADLLYAFVAVPETINMIFLGVLDITTKSIPLAILAALAQFAHSHLAMPKPEPKKKDAAPSFQDDMMRSMHLNMRYTMPILIGVIAYSFSAAVAIYFTISALTMVAQEVVLRKHR